MNHNTVLAAILLAAAFPCFASSELENTLVTGVYTPVPAAAATASVTVLDSKTLRALNKRNVADMLKTVPGLLVEQQGGPGGLTAVSIRGGEANFTLVLMDGVPLNDPTNSRGGSFDFANLDPALIERIEIVRGPQSAVYGSDALAGVINIITRRGQGSASQRLRIERGENDFSDTHFNASGELAGWRYALDLAQRDEGEQTPGSSRETDHANIRLDWSPGSGQRISASYRYLDGQSSSFPEQSGGPDFASSDALDESEYTESTYSLGWQMDVSEAWTSGLSASGFERDESYASPGISPYDEVPPNAADTEFQRQQLQWVNTLNIFDNTRLNIGADYREEDGESVGYLEFGGFVLPTSFTLDRSTTGVFVDAQTEPLSGFLLQGSVRYDSPSDLDSETTIKLGGKYRLSQMVTVSANWGEGFKLPSFFALGHALVGNPDLKPETAESWDLGAAFTLAEGLQVEITYFSNEYKNLVTFDPELFTNVNSAQVKSSGAELQVDWSPSSQFRLQAQSTYIDMDVENESSVLLGRPEWKAGVTGLWSFNESWSTALDYQWTGEQYASSLHTGDPVIEQLDDFQQLDWSLRWQAQKWLQLELAVDNLLDEDYQTAVGFRAPGRLVRLSLGFRH